MLTSFAPVALTLISERLVHPSNACIPIDVRFLFKTTDDSDVQFAKVYSFISSRLSEIVMVLSDVQPENANASIV